MWQTKVEWKRKGTRFAVPFCSVSGVPWLEQGWRVFQEFIDDRDFFLWDLSSETKFDRVPVSYPRSAMWLQFFLRQALEVAHRDRVLTDDQIDTVGPLCDEVTWHSMRVTLLDAAVHSKTDDKLIALQANWKDPSQLVLKYARQRKQLSVQMVKDLALQLREQWKPDVETFEIEDVPDVVEPDVPEYVVRSKLPSKALVASDLRCHVRLCSANPTHTLCGRVKLADATSFGPEPPGMVCQHCSNKLKSA